MHSTPTSAAGIARMTQAITQNNYFAFRHPTTVCLLGRITKMELTDWLAIGKSHQTTAAMASPVQRKMGSGSEN
jgi:hypothetical protein